MIFKSTVLCLSSLLCIASCSKPAYPNNQTAPSAASLIDSGLAALGGEEVVENITSVIYQSPSHYRSQTLMESYNLLQADKYMAIVGHQNISFLYSDNATVRQRIDRYYEISEYWYWATALLEPRDYTLVLQSGTDGYACFTKGNNEIVTSGATVHGYVEASLAEYYVYQALKLSPNILTKVKSNNATSSFFVILEGGIQMPAVHDAVLNVTVIFDPSSHLPYIIRSYEDNNIFGPSTSDLQVYNYTSIDGIMFPQRFVWVYNGAVLEDFLVSDIIVNPEFPTGYFDGLPANSSGLPKAAPQKSAAYGHAELGEFSSNMLWEGEYAGTLGNVSAINPIANLPHFWYLSFLDAPTYKQWVIEFEDAVIVSDAPPHQNTLVLEWVKTTLKKEVTHLWLSHHHHDHSYGALEYVQAGAKLIVPEVASSYWSKLPDVEIISYSEQKPYIHKDSNMQARFIWESPAPHSEDWSYGIVTSACPNSNETVALFEADVWTPGFPDAGIDQAVARQWLDQTVANGLPKSTLVTPAHGDIAPLADLIDYLGYPYPNYTIADWKTGGRLC